VNIVVSVIIPNWNGKELLARTLDRLKKQSFKDFEIIVVDNGSIDGSVQFIKEHFPDVNILSLTENKGFAHACNLGIRYAKGEFIALLNNDAEPDKDWLFYLTDALSKYTDYSFFASFVLMYDKPDIVDSAGDCFSPFGVAFKRGHRKEAKKYYKKEKVFGASASASIYRKDFFNHVGFFDEDLYFLYEDADISFRANLFGLKCLFVPEAKVFHHISASSKKGEGKKVANFFGPRNIEWVYFKNMPILLIFLTFIPHLIFIFVAFLLAIKKKRGKLYLKGKFNFFLNLGKIIKKRKQVLKNKRVSCWDLIKIFKWENLFYRSF